MDGAIVEILKILPNASILTASLAVAIYAIVVPKLEPFYETVTREREKARTIFEAQIERSKRRQVTEEKEKVDEYRDTLDKIESLMKTFSGSWLVKGSVGAPFVSFIVSLAGLYWSYAGNYDLAYYALLASAVALAIGFYSIYQILSNALEIIKISIEQSGGGRYRIVP